MTFSIKGLEVTFSIMTLSITIPWHNVECRCAERRVLCIVKLKCRYSGCRGAFSLARRQKELQIFKMNRKQI
jgi:hypothetical protein